MLKFGCFDHVDYNGKPLGEQLEDRLKLIELLEAERYHAYHVAEHHSTPLGVIPCPSVFLAAVAGRTRRIRFGPLVYVLPLHHPLRLYEEICLLDHLSGGRLELGVGKGGALFEHHRYGVGADVPLAQAMYHEAFSVLMQACEQEVLNFEGRFFKFNDYLVRAKPLQRPHPPLWYGAASVEGLDWAVPRAVNVVSLGPTARAADIARRYRRDWAAAGRAACDLPRIGILRHIVVAETDGAAQRIALDAYQPWRESMEFLWERCGVAFALAAAYPPRFDELMAIGHGIAGSPTTVRSYIEDLVRQTGVNYIGCQMVFGSMALEAAAASIQLFAREVVPKLSLHTG
jgi:alkanesulfonate monooxygenase SsuD/methylene tetrahydromethanopterin reductase-like flavin-dependent oxidoreductase (luciferase family)